MMNEYQQTIKNAMDKVEKNRKILLKQRCEGKKMAILYYLNEDHTYRPCGLDEWSKQFGEVRQVADDTINGCRVSTVWLGTNSNYFGGPPLVFETMVFTADDSDILCIKYTTWDQAIAGHKDAIDWVKNGCKEEAE